MHKNWGQIDLPKEKTLEMYLAKFSLTTDLINQEYSLDRLLDRLRTALQDPGDPIQLKARGKVFWWAFEYLYPLQSEFGPVLVCRLLKISDDEITRFDWGNRRSFTEPYKDHVLDSALFAVCVEKELVLLQKRPGISIRQFCSAFSNIVDATAELSNTLLSPVKNRDTFIGRIRSLDRITSAKFILIASNPHDASLYAKLDEQIRLTRSSKGELKFEGERLRYDGTVIEEGALSTSDGNGKGEIKGTKNDIKTTVRSDDEEYLEQANIQSSDEEFSANLLRVFAQKIRDFLKRKDTDEQK